ncbi:tripartite tricarboxylate transporter TctB family protein [Nocardiopsis sp. L17-MgMaSL7]|uniref:tripartite tricarboxylate transporter TctB family protein n=1 Tax=Nocardiopsis sp. L17-MgMaSL7 TaxID=1938893 RepID=UPI000D8C1C40|nr:tripartite tricarboxylate transporter TctB family protein [Nocardiopsis sp. L17-MgMaSL7]PWV51173.1 putative tricarboxylic transport membrane protein [Nocardiopsis sp. L17-MgMaSL7]
MTSDDTRVSAGAAETAGTGGTDEAPTVEAAEDHRADVDQTTGTDEAESPDPETSVWRGPTAWVIPALVAVLGAVALWGGLTIEAPPNATRPGPGAFPGTVGVLLLVTAVCMTVVNLRNRNTGDGATTLGWFESRPVLLVVAGLVVHVALLEFVGWLLAGALLFWIVAYAFGARAYLRDAIVALSMSAAVQVGFSLGLGLSLPGGFLEMVL